nr:hypothetical protein [Candidatus Hamiltonella defensa]
MLIKFIKDADFLAQLTFLMKSRVLVFLIHKSGYPYFTWSLKELTSFFHRDVQIYLTPEQWVSLLLELWISSSKGDIAVFG